jgi:hypothetical protein
MLSVLREKLGAGAVGRGQVWRSDASVSVEKTRAVRPFRFVDEKVGRSEISLAGKMIGEWEGWVSGSANLPPHF